MPLFKSTNKIVKKPRKQASKKKSTTRKSFPKMIGYKIKKQKLCKFIIDKYGTSNLECVPVKSCTEYLIQRVLRQIGCDQKVDEIFKLNGKWNLFVKEILPTISIMSKNCDLGQNYWCACPGELVLNIIDPNVSSDSDNFDDFEFEDVKVEIKDEPTVDNFIKMEGKDSFENNIEFEDEKPLIKEESVIKQDFDRNVIPNLKIEPMPAYKKIKVEPES